MRQIILIGFSTTGKSTLVKRIIKDFNNRDEFDTDKKIAISYGGSISDIYYTFGDIKATYKAIINLEIDILRELSILPDNLIIAAGPGIPLHKEFKNYIQVKKPHVVLLERSAEDIYSSLKNRRETMRSDPKHQRSDFGIWDLGIMVKEENGELIELDKEAAIQKIKTALVERHKNYNEFANILINSTEIFDDKPLPKELVDII